MTDGRLCQDCEQPYSGVSWSGRCRRCHELRLLPAEPGTWEDWYVRHDLDGEGW